MILNYEDAEADFRKAIKINPQVAAVHFELAQVLYKTKRRDEALVSMEKAFSLNPSNEWYGKELINLYKEERRYEEAVVVAEKAFAATKKTNFLHQRSGYELLLNKYPAAIKTLDRIEKTDGIDEQLSVQKENIYLSLNKPKKAIAEIKKLSDAYPENLNYKGRLADLYMGVKKEKEALAIYQEILAKEPGNGYALFSMADYYKQKGDKEKYFNMVKLGMLSTVDIQSKVKVLTLVIPSQDFAPDHMAKCESLIDAFIESNPNTPEAFLFKGDLYLQQRNLAEARTWYKRALATDNRQLMAWEQVIFCDQQTGRNDWLKEDATLMVSQFPEYPQAHLYLSLANRYLGLYEAGLKPAKTAVSLAENEDDLITYLVNLGDLAHYAKSFDLSDSAYEAALALDPNNSLALNNFAYFLSLRNKDLDKAENMSKRSIELDPGNPSNLDTHGWILYMKGDYTQAKEQIEKSLELAPNNAEVVEHYGDVLSKLGMIEQAKMQWLKAIELGGNSNELKQKAGITK